MLGLMVQVALAQEPAPVDLPAPPQDSPEEPAPTPTFGMDVVAGYGGQSLLGAWTEPGIAGVGWLRVGLYGRPMDVGGPRVGAGVWAQTTLLPRQSASELWDDEVETFPFSVTHFGLDVSMRADPSAPWSGVFDFGFGRLDLVDYFDGPMTIPTFNLRAGARRSLRPMFVEGAARAGWGAARDENGELADWWVVGVELGVGANVR